MTKLENQEKIIISFRQILFLAIAQLGGAAVIYLPGVQEAGRNVWISNIIASIIGYIIIYCNYLPISLSSEYSMTKTLNKYWGKLLGGVANLYYLIFFFILCLLIVSDVFYFGKITMPETPGYVFIVFLIVPAVYAVKLGVETMARLIEFLIPLLAIIYCILFIMVIPKLDINNLQPIMSEGIRPVLSGAIPNMNFPYAQILPVAFYYKYTKTNNKRSNEFLKYTFIGIFMSTVLLTFRSLASAAAFEEATLITLTYPPFSTISLIEIGDIIERLDLFMLAIFYVTTFIKFTITYNIICEIISDYFETGEPRDFSVPIAILIGISMPFLIPRLDVVFKILVPYFFISLPLLVPIPLILFITIKIKNNRRIKTAEQ